jgi:hypothetical protein
MQVSTMRIATPFVLLCLFLTLPMRMALPADVGPLSITVPAGFDGPTTGENEGTVMTAWIKHHAGDAGGTVLQISVVEMGTALNGITVAQRAEGAKHYLSQFIDGVARRRDNFNLGEVESVSLAGVPAARVQWTGGVGEIQAIGVMYCVLVGSSVISLHAEDVGSEITPAMKLAMVAIEGVHAH